MNSDCDVGTVNTDLDISESPRYNDYEEVHFGYGFKLLHKKCDLISNSDQMECESDLNTNAGTTCSLKNHDVESNCSELDEIQAL